MAQAWPLAGETTSARSAGLAKTPQYWETVTRNIALLDEWGRIFPPEVS
jgi:hypothetical protein